MAGYIGSSYGPELDSQLGLFYLEQGKSFLVVILFHLTSRIHIGENSSSSPLIRSLSPFEIIPRLSTLISVRHLFAKTGGLRRKKAVKSGRTEVPQAGLPTAPPRCSLYP